MSEKATSTGLEQLEQFAEQRRKDDRVTNVIIEGEPGTDGVETAVATIPAVITGDGRIAKFDQHDEFPDDVRTLVITSPIDKPISRFKAQSVAYRNIVYVDPSPGYNRRWADAVVKTSEGSIGSVYRVHVNPFESEVYLKEMEDSA